MLSTSFSESDPERTLFRSREFQLEQAQQCGHSSGRSYSELIRAYASPLCKPSDRSGLSTAENPMADVAAKLAELIAI
jgi:hypothetical protein